MVADSVWGLRWSDTGLYAGRDDFTAGDLPKFTLGVSIDGGQTFDGMMEICQADIIGCASGSRTATACEAIYSQPGGWRGDYIDGPRCAGGAAGAANGGSGGAGNIGGGAGATSTGSGDVGSGAVGASAGSGGVSAGGGAGAASVGGDQDASGADGGCGCATPGSSPRSFGGAIVLSLLVLRGLRPRI